MKRPNFSTTNPNAMIPILVLIHDRNVLSFAMCTRRFRTRANLLSSEIFGEHFAKYSIIVEKNSIYSYSLAVYLLSINKLTNFLLCTKREKELCFFSVLHHFFIFPSLPIHNYSVSLLPYISIREIQHGGK